MGESEIIVNTYLGFAAIFSPRPLQTASKWAKIKDNRMTPSMEVRRFRLADLDRIEDIESASFGRDAYDRNLFAEFFHKCGGLFLVVTRRGVVCGYIVTCIRGDRAEVVSVAVDPGSRGKGVASALMESTLRRLRRRRIARVVLMVKVTNRPARRFYEKFGFGKTRIVRRYYEDGADGVSMARALPSTDDGA